MFRTLCHARVIIDSNTKKSKGYGFVAFRDKSEAEKAISSMNGVWLGSRTIRVNWATQKPLESPFEKVLTQSPKTNCTVYFGNLPTISETEVIDFFKPYGQVEEVKLQPDRAYAFVRMQTHEEAAMAICRLQGTQIQGKTVKVAWGKERVYEDFPFVYPSETQLPSLNDPIAASAAAAAQAAVLYQLQQQMMGRENAPPQDAADYYAYYYHYFYGQHKSANDGNIEKH